MDPAALAGIAALAMLLGVLVGAIRRAPRCPRCGSLYSADVGAGILKVRRCDDCFEIYEVKRS